MFLKISSFDLLAGSLDWTSIRAQGMPSSALSLRVFMTWTALETMLAVRMCL